MQALITVILPVFLLVGFGYVLVWRKIVSESTVDGTMQFAQQIAIPCLLFNAIAHLDLSTGFDPKLLLSFYTGAIICFTVGFLGARYLFGRSLQDCVAIGVCALFSNTVLLGLPITERAYGTEALAGNYAIIAVHSPFCYAIGITLMELVRAREAGTAMAALPAKVLKAMFSNSLVIGLALGFIVNLSGVNLPEAFQAAVDMLVRSALPTALLALGGILYRYRPEGDIKVILFTCAISLILHPALVFLLGGINELSDAALRSAVMTSAMAPGINVYIFASVYQSAQRVAASSVLLATALSIFSAWFWLSVLP
ncbi:AEC family transporter [Planktotalea sp.]|uniref:AEC family transporter n=1 Tax=Planktotalea sp. TaxID=2029877 RepID=UPI0032980263